MIPWCMRAANSAGATAKGQIATTKHTHSLDPKNWAKLLWRKDVKYRKAGPVLKLNKFACDSVRRKPHPLYDLWT